MGNTETDFQKNFSRLRRQQDTACKFWGHSVQRRHSCACVKSSPSGVYFFYYFNCHKTKNYADLKKATEDRSIWRTTRKSLHSTVASSAVRLRRDGVTLNFDLLTQKRNQVICDPRCTSDKSLAKICQ